MRKSLDVQRIARSITDSIASDMEELRARTDDIEAVMSSNEKRSLTAYIASTLTSELHYVSGGFHAVSEYDTNAITISEGETDSINTWALAEKFTEEAYRGMDAGLYAGDVRSESKSNIADMLMDALSGCENGFTLSAKETTLER